MSIAHTHATPRAPDFLQEPPVIPEERRHLILRTLAQKELVSIAELTELLGVSHMTVRRDVYALERDGRLVQISGGVQATQKIDSEPSRTTKRSLRFDEKSAIAREAAQRIPKGATVYLDAGTTCLAIAELIAHRDDILVVTNDFPITDCLIKKGSCQLYHTGGQVIRDNESCAGESAAQAIRNLNLDIAFISASSWNNNWISTPTETKVPVKKAILAASAQCILACDTSKYGKVGFFNAISTNSLSEIITDEGLAEGAREAIRRAGVTLTLAVARA